LQRGKNAIYELVDALFMFLSRHSKQDKNLFRIKILIKRYNRFTRKIFKKRCPTCRTLSIRSKASLVRDS